MVKNRVVTPDPALKNPVPKYPVLENALPNEVQVYLRAVTRSLPGQARSAVAAELHANLHQRMLDHSLGLSVEAAWAAALRDFGPPQQAARAFGRVYRWPQLLRTALAALALGTAGYAAARTLHWEALGGHPVGPVQEPQPPNRVP